MPLFRITLVQCLNASQCIRATKGYQVMQCCAWVVEVTVPWVHQFWIYHGTEGNSSASWVHRWQLLVEPEEPAIMGGDSNQDGVRLTLLPLVAPVLVHRRHFVVTVVQGCTWQVQRCTWQLLLHLNRLPASPSTLSEQDLHTRRISDACIARHWIKLESWIFVGAQPLLSQPWETTEFLLWIKLYNPHLHPWNPSWKSIWQWPILLLRTSSFPSHDNSIKTYPKTDGAVRSVIRFRASNNCSVTFPSLLLIVHISQIIPRWDRVIW